MLLNEQNCAPEKEETKKFEKELEKKKIKTAAFHAASEHMDMSIVNKFSSFSKAIRTIAFFKRYVQELRKRKPLKTTISCTDTKRKCNKQILTTNELENAKLSIIRTCQEQHFGKEMQKLRDKQCMPKDSRLKPLYPFIDENGVLREGVDYNTQIQLQ